MGMVLSTVQADAQTRSLSLYNTHTKERADITYMRNGRHTEDGLRQLNHFLRDWRRNEPTRMDPRLFDMLYELYRDTNASQPIHVVSAYRSAATNSMLRSTSSGVADNSQHTRGNAIDFFIPGVRTSELRQRALRMNGGGVGYYPRSGTPFVHIDVGGVRHWPRMNRNELMALFPDGKTMHMPSDGRPLPGYQQAKADYERRQRGEVQVARGDGQSSGGLLAALFGNRGNSSSQASQQQATAQAQPAPARQQAQPQQQQQAQPQPQQEQRREPAQTPQTILAALPERSVPVPLAAPRPTADVAPQQTASAVEQIIEQAAGEQPAVAAEVRDEVQIANVPLPTRRPDIGTQMVAQQATADEDEAGISDVTVAAIAGNLPSSGGVEAIGDLLALSAAEARAARRPDSIPVPALRTGVGGPVTAGAGEQLAALVSGHQGVTPVSDAQSDRPRLAGLPAAAGAETSTDPQAADMRDLEEKQQRMAALTQSAGASPRVAVLSRSPGSDAMAAADSGVRTTAKSARPQPGQAQSRRRAAAIPVETAMTQWAFARNVGVVTANGPDGSMSARSREVVMARPDTVYTSGFERRVPDAQNNRFTGNAVHFLSVARFGQ